MLSTLSNIFWGAMGLLLALIILVVILRIIERVPVAGGLAQKAESFTGVGN